MKELREHMPEENTAAVDEAPWPAMPAQGWSGTTGDDGVDLLLDALSGLPEQPVHLHGSVFARLHEELQARLDSDSGHQQGLAATPGEGS